MKSRARTAVHKSMDGKADIIDTRVTTTVKTRKHKSKTEEIRSKSYQAALVILLMSVLIIFWKFAPKKS